MAVKPDIVHVVGYPEADHAVTAREVVESCAMARRAIENAYRGQIDLTSSPNVLERVDELVFEARILRDAIRSLGDGESDDPLADVAVLAEAVKAGLMDAPQLVNNPYGKGEISTIIDQRGACVVVDSGSSRPISEKDRISNIMKRRKQ